MEKQLNKILRSYDKSIDLGRKGIDSYRNLPDKIIHNPNYKLFEKMQNENNLSDSGRKEIYEYLSPTTTMKFIDLGCCLNLMFRGFDKWESTYYGVDISPKTIQLLEEYTQNHNVSYGSLFCGSMHQTPYEDNYFDIGCCIGSLEYFEKDFVKVCMEEFLRIMKPKGKFVLDIPNVGTPECEITSLIEKSLGREDKFDLSILEFENMIGKHFIIDKKENVGPMIQYFLNVNK
ncbi:MAG: class I SAM-dependent methyltransferase [Lachnotalea sp.]